MYNFYEMLWNGICFLTFVLTAINTTVSAKNRREIINITRRINGPNVEP